MMSFHGLKAASFSLALGGAVLTFGAGGAAANPFPPEVWQCYRNESFTVLATEKKDEVGTRFLVRKTTPAIKADCAIEQRPSDHVIGEGKNADDMLSLYYVALVKTLLILDSGTGPDRRLVIQDLRTGKPVLEADYSVQDNCDPTSGCESDEFRIDEKGLTFWREVAEPATAKNCTNYARFMKTTGSAAIEEKTFFNFTTLKTEAQKGRRCVARQ